MEESAYNGKCSKRKKQITEVMIQRRIGAPLIGGSG